MSVFPSTKAYRFYGCLQYVGIWFVLDTEVKAYSITSTAPAAAPAAVPHKIYRERYLLYVLQAMKSTGRPPFKLSKTAFPPTSEVYKWSSYRSFNFIQAGEFATPPRGL